MSVPLYDGTLVASCVVAIVDEGVTLPSTNAIPEELRDKITGFAFGKNKFALTTDKFWYNQHLGAGEITDEMVYNAARNGYVDILKRCREITDEPDINQVLATSAIEGRTETMEYCRKEGAAEIDSALACAASTGEIDAMELCFKWGAVDVERAMANAAFFGKTEAMKLCWKHGSKDVETALAISVEGGNDSSVALCLEWGARNLETAIEKADEMRCEKISRMCREKLGKEE